MRCRIEINEGALIFDVENSIAPLQGFRKLLNRAGKYTLQKVIDFMGFITINTHFIVISSLKGNGSNIEILYTFLVEPLFDKLCTYSPAISKCY